MWISLISELKCSYFQGKQYPYFESTIIPTWALNQIHVGDMICLRLQNCFQLEVVSCGVNNTHLSL